MKKEIRNVEVSLLKATGEVGHAKCSCPAGLSGYWNHVMALLFEVAEYSLNRLSSIPDEISCTSKIRQWGLPSENISFKNPVMFTTVNTSVKKKMYKYNFI